MMYLTKTEIVLRTIIEFEKAQNILTLLPFVLFNSFNNFTIILQY